jgi:hypothetical protein
MNTGINTNQEVEVWKLMLSQANHLVKSGALPSTIKSAEQAVAIIQYGRELNLPPMTAIQNISMINGKPTLSANLVGARLKNAGYKFKVKKYTDDVVELEFTDLDGDKHTFDYSMKEATQAGNASKDVYKKYNKEMLYARCLTRGGRIVAPEVLAGVYSPEEFEVEEKVEPPKREKAEVTETVEPTDKNGELVEEIEEANVREVDKFAELLKRISEVKSLSGLKAIYSANQDMANVTEFTDALSKRKEELIAEEVEMVEGFLESDKEESIDIKKQALEEVDACTTNEELDAIGEKYRATLGKDVLHLASIAGKRADLNKVTVKDTKDGKSK